MLNFMKTNMFKIRRIVFQSRQNSLLYCFSQKRSFAVLLITLMNTSFTIML